MISKACSTGGDPLSFYVFFSESSRKSSVYLEEAGAVKVQLPLGLVCALSVCVCVSFCTASL